MCRSIIASVFSMVCFTLSAAADSEMLLPDSFLNLYFTEQTEWTVFIAEAVTQKAYLAKFNIPSPLPEIDSSDKQTAFNIVKDFPISTGKQKGSKRSEWDLRTPEGFYRITQYRRQNTLHEKFGSGAFILDYPNLLDRTLKKTGSGIWIHGTDRTGFIDCDSEGCIRMKNDDILFLVDFLVPYKTPVFIVDKINWQTENDLRRKKTHWENRFSEWIAAQNDRDLKKYLDFYHPSFYAPQLNMDIGRWTLHHKNSFVDDPPALLSFEKTDVIYQDNFLLWQGKKTVLSAQNDVTQDLIVLWRKFDDQWFIVLEK